jgi:DNA-binding NtrC family response regulator
MSKKKILLVDDDEDMLILCSRELIKAGYDIITSRSGKHALKLLSGRKTEIMLIILDILIPDIDGRKLALQIKKVDPKIPIIFYSNYGYKDRLSKWGIPEDADYVMKGEEKKLLYLIKKRTEKLSSKE